MPEIPVRIAERRSEMDWQREVEAEWGLAFDVTGGPLARMVWVRSETVSELMLVCPHCICDGVTGVTLIREILSLLDRPETPIDGYPLFRSVKEIVPGSLLADRGAMIRAYLKSLGVRILFSIRPIRPFPQAVERGRPFAVRWQLEEAESKLLIGRCQSEEVTVHAALCVALLDAYRVVKKEVAKNKVICPVDIRRYVREIRKDMMFAFAPIVELEGDKRGDDRGEGVRGARMGRMGMWVAVSGGRIFGSGAGG